MAASSAPGSVWSLKNLVAMIVPGAFGLARNIIEHLRGVRLRSIQKSKEFFFEARIVGPRNKGGTPKDVKQIFQLSSFLHSGL